MVDLKLVVNMAIRIVIVFQPAERVRLTDQFIFRVIVELVVLLDLTVDSFYDQFIFAIVNVLNINTPRSGICSRVNNFSYESPVFLKKQ